MDKLEKFVKSKNNTLRVERIMLEGKTAEHILNFLKDNEVETLIIPKLDKGPIEKSLVGGGILSFIDEVKGYAKECFVVQ